jgi:hypothetical protein
VVSKRSARDCCERFPRPAKKKTLFCPAAHVSANVSFRAKGHRGP